MKKIISMAVAAVLMVSALSALELEFGARGILGRNLDNGKSLKDNYELAKADKTFDAGFSVYGMFALFGNLGIQAEANYIRSEKDFKVKEGNKYVTKEYELHTLDLAPMVWLNLPLGKLALGLGAGPNFSIPVASVGEVKNATKDQFTVGLIAGTDFKFYFTDHLGLVLSGRYITDWTKKTVTIDAYGQSMDTGIPEYSFNRKTIYGGIGLELKLL